MHILSASRPFCQGVSRIGQAEPMVFTIMCVPFFVVGKALRRGCYQNEESAQSGAEAQFRIIVKVRLRALTHVKNCPGT